MRLEWPGDSPGDPFDPATVPDPPPWVDCMTVTDDGAAVRLRLVVSGPEGEPTVTRVEVVNPDGALTRRYLRGVGLGQVVDEVGRVLADWSVSRRLGDTWRREVHRPGRAGRPDVHYAEWARRYVEALEVSRSPIKHIVNDDRAKGDHRTEQEVRAKVNRARDRGLLTRPPKGRAGGELTDRCRRLLSGEEVER